jgi:hypothetical protein
MTHEFAVSTGPANFLLIEPGANDLFAVEYRAENPSAVHHIKMPVETDTRYQMLKALVAVFQAHERSRCTPVAAGSCMVTQPEHYFEIHEAQALINEEEWLCTEEQAFYDSVPAQTHESLADFYKAIGFDPVENRHTN